MMKHGVNSGLWITVGVFLFTIYFLGAITYTISEDEIIIKLMGIRSNSVDISKITSISRSYNPFSTPASSLKRLRVNYKPNLKNSYILISPTREQEFIDTLKSMNLNIEIDVPNPKGKWRVQDWDI